MSNKRTLRSRNSKSQDLSNLFNFDYINPYVQKSKAIKVSSKTSSVNLYHYSEDSKLPPKSSTQKPMNVKLVDDIESPRKSKLRDDPLEDSIYETFHKQMWRQESRMVNSDRLRLMSDFDTLNNQKKQLDQYSWDKFLPSITKINNVNDHEELERKRLLTLNEIDRRMSQYQNWKKRLENFKNQKKLSENSYKLDEYSTPIDVLRQSRLSERELPIRPIKLILNNGYSLYIDANSTPKIVKDSNSLTSDEVVTKSLHSNDSRRSKVTTKATRNLRLNTRSVIKKRLIKRSLPSKKSKRITRSVQPKISDILPVNKSSWR
ncbi:hypothetical protein CLIB1444_01S01420 [[Candida] jaroonii]|uniref:Uncharacterized protein n=1 Tax=[Candida] jaroonii TaxID=467808 RepID=A0ACA9XZY0_9ASCO|nr:hypothetical protein CLIB1444_01S01420 [[Candida] jaroonii]